MAPNERVIRDALAQHLDLLEAGLDLVEIEHRLPNPLGAGGSVDILARDRFRNFVIIEIKKSNQSARHTINELCKYVFLFIAQHGVPAASIRCIVASTEWHELLVPLAEFAQSTSAQVEGIQLVGDADGTPSSAARVSLPQRPARISAFRCHSIFLFREANTRNEAVALIETALKATGVTSYVVVAMDYHGENKAVIYPHAAYVVPTEIPPTLRTEIECRLADEYGPREDDAWDDDTVEDFCLAALMEHYSGPRDYHECGYPEKFSSMCSSGWDCCEIARFGRMSEAVLSKTDVLRLIKGLEGQHTSVFQRITTPRLQGHWKETLDSLSRSLEGNQVWLDGVRWFCDCCRDKHPNGTIVFSIYNPMNIPMSLYMLLAQQKPEYLPQLEIECFDEESRTIDGLLGRVEWDRVTHPKSVAAVLDGLFEDVEELMWTNHFGVLWESDVELMRRHGLQYSLVRVQSDHEDRLKAETVTVAADTVSTSRQDDSLMDVVAMPAYVAANQPYLKQLVAAMADSATFV